MCFKIVALLKIRKSSEEVEDELLEMRAENGIKTKLEIPSRSPKENDEEPNSSCPNGTTSETLCKSNEPVTAQSNEVVDSAIASVVNETTSTSKTASSHQQMGFLRLFGRKVLMATLLSVGLQMAQQLSGINAIMFYSSDMFMTAKVPSTLIQYAVAATGLLVILASLATVRIRS